MNLSFDQLIGVATIGAAWGALVLSLYTWYQSRPVRRVDVVMRYGPHAKARLGPYIQITFINEQGPMVLISEVGFESAGGRKGIRKSRFFEDCDDPLPTEVPAGHSASYFFEFEDSYLRGFVQLMEEEEPRSPIRPYCKDATGKLYKGPDLRQEIKSAFVWVEEVYRQETNGTE